MVVKPKSKKHCRTCECSSRKRERTKKCKHVYNAEPSYTMKVGEEKEAVWVCVASSNYCDASKREAVNSGTKQESLSAVSES